MSLVPKLDAIEALSKTPASDVKKLGWRGVMRAVQKSGRVVVTNHDAPEAVILPASEYEAIVAALDELRQKDLLALDALRRSFDERLAALQSPDAAAKLMKAARSRTKLRGKVVAGASY